MAREIGPTNQWQEPVAAAVAAPASTLYPIFDEDSGLWGWTTVPANADGIIGVGDGDLLGVDDSTTVGGARVLSMGKQIAALITT